MDGTIDGIFNQQQYLTYCVSPTFGTHYGKVVQAMKDAAAAWTGTALPNVIRFRHLPQQDASCTATNLNVIFDVRPVFGASYAARAFFPSWERRISNVIISVCVRTFLG